MDMASVSEQHTKDGWSAAQDRLIQGGRLDAAGVHHHAHASALQWPQLTQQQDAGQQQDRKGPAQHVSTDTVPHCDKNIVSLSLTPALLRRRKHLM